MDGDATEMPVEWAPTEYATRPEVAVARERHRGRASRRGAAKGRPPNAEVRLGTEAWDVVRKEADCRDGEGTSPRSADRIRSFSGSTDRASEDRCVRRVPVFCLPREGMDADRAVRDHRLDA